MENKKFKDTFNLQQYIPDNDYMLVLGTSHSFGECRIEEKNQTVHNDSDIWCNRVAADLGLELCNLAVSGTDNYRLTNSLVDFLELVPDKSKCKMIISEARLHDQTEMFSNDFVADYSNEIDQIFPDIFRGKDIGRKSSHAFSDNLYHRYTSKDFESPHRIQNAIESSGIPIGNEIPREIYKRVQRKMRNYYELDAITAQAFIKDLTLIRYMSSLCRIADIPFYWFCWDVYHNNQFNADYVAELFHYTTNVFDSKLRCFPKNASREYLQQTGTDIEKFNQDRCDCGHMKAPFHHWVAEAITKELKQNGH